jgi:hypothetical protein
MSLRRERFSTRHERELERCRVCGARILHRRMRVCLPCRQKIGHAKANEVERRDDPVGTIGIEHLGDHPVGRP